MKLSSVNLDAEAITPIYTCPQAQRAIVTANICNRGTAIVKVRVALTSGAAPTDADWIEYETPIPAAGSATGSVLQLTGLALGAGQKIYARASGADVTATVYGVEQGAA